MGNNNVSNSTSKYVEYCFQLSRLRNVIGVTEYAAVNDFQKFDGSCVMVPAIKMKLRDGKHITIPIQDEEVRDKVLETLRKRLTSK